jgi:hypothetical protein
MKFKRYNNEKSLGHFISIILLILISFLYFKNNELNFLLSFVLILNLLVTFFFPPIYKPLSNFLILLGEIIGRIVAPLVFFTIFVSLIVPIGFFYRIFIFKSYEDWVNSSEGNNDDFKNEF